MSSSTSWSQQYGSKLHFAPLRPVREFYAPHGLPFPPPSGPPLTDMTPSSPAPSSSLGSALRYDTIPPRSALQLQMWFAGDALPRFPPIPKAVSKPTPSTERLERMYARRTNGVPGTAFVRRAYHQPKETSPLHKIRALDDSQFTFTPPKISSPRAFAEDGRTTTTSPGVFSVESVSSVAKKNGDFFFEVDWCRQTGRRIYSKNPSEPTRQSRSSSLRTSTRGNRPSHRSSAATAAPDRARSASNRAANQRPCAVSAQERFQPATRSSAGPATGAAPNRARSASNRTATSGPVSANQRPCAVSAQERFQPTTRPTGAAPNRAPSASNRGASSANPRPSGAGVVLSAQERRSQATRSRSERRPQDVERHHQTRSRSLQEILDATQAVVDRENSKQPVVPPYHEQMRLAGQRQR